MNNFDANKAKNYIIQWIRDWFKKNGDGCNAVVGISGGKDSTVAAALCVEALGRDRVIGVLMPNGKQTDIKDGIKVTEMLDIETHEININHIVSACRHSLENNNISLSNQTLINLPARVRMTILYAISQSLNGRVVNTCNLSEDYIGYSTKYGDAAGDFSPLGKYTVQEVKAIGYALGIPKIFIEKAPSDGLCGKTDEDNLGFSYEVLDKYIRTGEIENKEIKGKIDNLHIKNKFKMELMATCPYEGGK